MPNKEKSMSLKFDPDYHDSYQDCLDALKAICGGTSENEAIALAIISQFPKCEMRILDVGTGDGKSVVKVARKLANEGIQTDILGIDIEPQLKHPETSDGVRYRFLKQDFLNFEAEQKFDVILVRQSMYYFPDIDLALERMRTLLATRGIVVVVCWEQGCVLRTIVEILDWTNPALLVSAEMISKRAAKYNLTKKHHEFYNGPVFMQEPKKNNFSIERPLKVLLRGRFVDCNGRKILKSYLAKCKDIESRLNSIIILGN